MSDCLKKEIGLSIVQTPEDVLTVANYVFELISYGSTKTLTDFRIMFPLFKSGEIGGRCGIHSEVFCWILQNCYKISCRGYNHGLVGYDMTHVVSLVTLNQQEYLFDPYFCKYYKKADGMPLTFKGLLEFIEERQFSNILEVRGQGKKRVEGSLMVSKEFEEYVYHNRYNRNDGIKEMMMKIFATIDPRVLLLVKIPCHIKREEYELN